MTRTARVTKVETCPRCHRPTLCTDEGTETTYCLMCDSDRHLRSDRLPTPVDRRVDRT